MAMRRSLAVLGAGGLAAALVTLTPATAGGQTAGCAPPYSPVAFTQQYPAQEVAPEVPGTDITTPPQPVVADTDGDGVADTIGEGDGDTATITRGSGVVELTAPGATRVLVSGVADIDGDSRDELAVIVVGGADEGTYLVAGTVADGTTTVAAAGVLLTAEVAGVGLQPDDSDRLLVSRSATPTSFPSLDTFDATDTLALGPGADATTTGPEVTREGSLLAFVDTGDAVLGLVIGAISIDGPLSLTLVDVGEPGVDIELTSDPEPAYGNRSGPFGPLEVLRGPAGTFVRLSQSSGSGAAQYIWSLDDPCTPYVGPVTTTTTAPSTPAATAPAAQPVATDARFTG